MARPKAAVCAGFLFILLCIVAIIVCISVLVHVPCSEKAFRGAAVAADSATCSNIGRDILQRGGSAVDGAIAALLCTSVINPQSMGLGGGSILTVMDRNGDVRIINSRETVPKRFKANLLNGCSGSLVGSQWIGVPGEIRGYERAHLLFGRLPWASLFQPTIKLARDGFPIPELQGRFIQLADNKTLPLRKLFSDENGKMLKAGDTVKFPKLADTLEVIANQGAKAFYTGKIAEDLVHDIQQAGGSLSMEDLASYNVTVTDPLTIPLGDYHMYVPPPPAGGVILSVILNIMKGYSLNSMSLEGEQRTLTYHRYVEAFKFANSLRKYIRDPQFSSGALSSKAKSFTEQSFADHIRSLISDDKSHDAQYYDISPPHVDSMGTTHVSVLAEDGAAVSATSSINYIFGSKVFSPRTGVILNNQLSDFCGKADHIVAGEQPPSSMSPALLTSRYNTLVIGASGGSMITTGMASTLMNHIWFGKTLEESIAAPIVFVDSKNALKFEPNFDKSLIKALNALGHTQKNATYFYNVVNAVEKDDDGCIHAVSDARKLGQAAGY